MIIFAIITNRLSFGAYVSMGASTERASHITLISRLLRCLPLDKAQQFFYCRSLMVLAFTVK